MSDKKMYGWFSEKAAETCAVNEYESANGGTVIVTCVDSDPEAKGYLWDDKKPVGEVLNHVCIVKYSDYEVKHP